MAWIFFIFSADEQSHFNPRVSYYFSAGVSDYVRDSALRDLFE